MVKKASVVTVSTRSIVSIAVEPKLNNFKSATNSMIGRRARLSAGYTGTTLFASALTRITSW